jgi:hypothetical protein
MAKKAQQSEMGEILDEQINVAISKRAKATLDEIRKNQRYLPAQVARGLIEAACAFYDQHKYFAFPVVIEPLDWRKKWPAAAEQDQSSYLPGPIDHLAHAAAAEKAADEEHRKQAKRRRAKP